MSGRIEITSGTEGLASQGVSDILDCPVDQLPQEAQEALLSIAGVNALSQGEIDASLEDLQIQTPSNPKAEGDCRCCGEKRPPLASKVIDSSGNAYITILYDGSQLSGGDQLSVFTGLINAAVENDVIDLTIMTCFNNFSRGANDLIKVLSLLSALNNCRAKKIITRAGCLCSVGDCALWLSGNDRRLGPMSWLMVKPPKTCGEGSMRDMELRSEVMKKQLAVFTDFIVDKGLLTKEEVNSLYDDEVAISLSFDDLTERVKTLK